MPKKTVQWDSQENKPKKSRYTLLAQPLEPLEGVRVNIVVAQRSQEPGVRIQKLNVKALQNVLQPRSSDSPNNTKTFRNGDMQVVENQF